MKPLAKSLCNPGTWPRSGCVAAVWLLTGSLAAADSSPEAATEKDFLTDLPIVLSVSRLPQRPSEIPGALTVLDRDMIARTGARDIADLLRWVPGFQVSTAFESGAPLASYHGGFSVYSSRIELLIDGRSAYSPYFLGNIAPGLQSVAIDDIERIEVLRGSNSAAYGARALLGVINIVTRHSADTLGQQVSLSVGDNGIRDARASLGWGDNSATFRLTADRRGDEGQAGSNNHNRIDRFNFRSDINLTARDALQLRFGGEELAVGKGTPGDISDALRDTRLQSGFAQVDWLHHQGADQDLLLRLSHTHERYNDQFPYSLVAFKINDSLNVSYNGHVLSDSLLLQHTVRQNDTLRWVWGAEYRNERVTSRPLFNQDGALVTDFTRLFGNLEWRIQPSLLLNAGVMQEHSSVNGANLAQRVMLNWQMAPGQTLRAGVSRAYRPPSSYENFSDVRYAWNGHLLSVNTVGTGQVQTESLTATELSYLGDFPQWRAALDVRAFHEQTTGFVHQIGNVRPRYYVNGPGFAIKGLEYQFKWQPWSGAQWLLNQTWTQIGPVEPFADAELAAPLLASSVMFFQQLPGDFDLSLMRQSNGISRFIGGGWPMQRMGRTDLRLSKRLHWGTQRGELALVVQNLGQPYSDYDPTYVVNRQAFVTLRLDN